MNKKFFQYSIISLYFLLILSYFNVAHAGIIPGCVTVNYEKLTIRPLCAVTLEVKGLKESSIEWKIVGSVAVNATLSCSSKCSTTVLTPLDATVSSFLVSVTGKVIDACNDGMIDVVDPIYFINVTVDNVDPLVANISPTPAVVCPGGTIALTANPLGGKAPYTYLWNNVGASTTQAITAGAGNYNVIVKDAYTMCAPVSVATTVTTNPIPLISNVAVTNATTCGGTGSVAITITGASGKYDVDLNGSGSFSTTNQTPNSSSGIINIMSSAGLVVKNVSVRSVTSGCVSAAFPINTSIGEPLPPAAPTVTSPVNYCTGDVASALSATGTALQWYYPLASSPPTNTTPTPSTNATGTVSYWVSQTVANCESAKSEIKVVVSDKPAFTLSSTSPSCAVPVGTISFIGLLPSTNYSISYIKDGGPASAAIILTNSLGVYTLTALGSGSYSSIKVSLGNCSTTSPTTVTLAVPPAPAAPTVTTPIAYCKGAATLPLTATASPGGSLLWYTALAGVGVATAPTPSSAAPGTTSYWVSQTVSGCESAKTEIKVVVNDVPTFTITTTNPTTCNSTDGTAVFSGLQPSSPYSVSYTVNGIPLPATNFATDIAGKLTVLGLPAATYTNVTVSIAGGCSYTNPSTFTLTSPASPIISTSTSSMCADGVSTKSLVATPAGGAWAFGTGSTPSIGTISGSTFTVGTVGGTAVISYNVSGCIANFAFSVATRPIINVSKADATTCGGLGTVNIAISNPAGNYDVDLDGNGTYEYTNQSTNAGNIIFSNLAVGAVLKNTQIRSTTTGCVSIPSTINTIIGQPAAPVSTTATTAMCADGVATRTLAATPAGGVWTLGAGSTASIGTVSGSTFTVGTIAGTAILNYTVSGCSTSVSISVAAPPILTITNPSAVCSPATVDLTAFAVTTGSSLGLSYTYFTNAAATTSLASYSAVATSGTYYIKGTTAAGCSVVKPVVVSVNTSVTASAGVNQSICANSVSLSGTATTGAITTWSASVAGTFSNANSLSSTFTPTVQPSSAVTITLNATAGTCSATPSSITVTFGNRPNISAGVDISLCSNAAVVNTLGTSTAKSIPVLWTTLGTGSFINSSATLLEATYSPSNADKANGVRLVLTTTNPSCNNADTVLVTFNPTPTISAGQPLSICSDKKFVVLNPSIAPANTPIKWTSNGTGFFQDATLAATRYFFSKQDSANGSVTLNVASTNSGACNANSSVVLTINATPYISVLPNYTACSYANSIDLVRGFVLPANTPVLWSVSGGSGTFETPTAVNTNYTLSAADKSNSTNPIYLILKSTAAGCVGSDTAVFRLTPAIVPSAGSNQTVCANVAKISLNGSVPLATNTVWTSNGTGVFSNANALKPDYILSAADRSRASLTFTLSTTDFGVCNIAVSTVVNLTPVPTIDAGPVDLAVCKSSVRIPLSGLAVPSATTVRWSSSGNGVFASPTSLTTNYVPTNKDKNDGMIYLTLRSTNASCNSRDSIRVTFADAPEVDAGANVSKCANNANLQLAGSVTGATTSGVWSTSGTGSFIPDANNKAAIYVPSASDKISGSTGVTLTLTSTSNGTCPAVSDNLKLTISASPVVSVGSDRTICANNKSIALSGAITGSTTTGLWSSTGDGSFSSTTINNPIYRLGAQDSVRGRATITYTSTNNGVCSPEANSFVLTITPSPVVEAGVNQTVCDNIAQINLSGTVSGATNTGVWSTNGSGGTFSNTTSLTTVYNPSNLDKKNGVVLILTSTNNGLCTASKDSVRITFSPSPVVDAGKDIVVCANVASINIAGTITGAATTGAWKSLSTTPGTFANGNSLSTVYTPSAFERTNGSVVLTLTSTNNGSCNPSTDQVNIRFSAPPIVTAGSNQSVCANVTNISLNGSVVGESNTGLWTSSGGGSFVPSNEALDAKYEPSATDRTLSSITLTLTSTKSLSCSPVSSDIKVTFTAAPKADAGSDRSVCGNNADIGLDGKVTGATGGIWTTNGQGTFRPDSKTLNATYIPGKAEIEIGTVTLTLTTTGNGASCNESFAKTTITMSVPPNADAGPDVVICKNDPIVQLNGKVVGGSGKGQWSTTGKGTFTPDNASLNAKYNPTDEDITKGILMILSSTNNQNCIADRDTVKITFSDAPVNAGSDIITCKNNPSVDLGGSISGTGSTGIWTTGGSGRFSPNANWNPTQSTSRTTYIPSDADKASGSPIRLTLVAQNIPNINCPGVLNDFLLVTINEGPGITLASDKEICSNTTVVPISGSISVATGGVWSTTGTGSFNPSNSSLNTNYLPSKEDFNLGAVKLRLTSIGNGVCKAASDTMILRFTKLPIVSAGVNQTFCSNVDSIPLNGIVSNVVGSMLWTSTGTGKFVPSTSGLKAHYLPTPADLANKSVDLSLVTIGNSVCGEVKDKITISFITAPAISAGADTTVCTNAKTLQLNAKADAGTSVVWSTSGKGKFSKINILNPVYEFNQDDFLNKDISLTVATNALGNCPSTKSVLKVTFAPKPTANAGKDTSVCENNTAIKLSGKVELASGGTWSSSGKGKFENINSLIAAYIPDQTDYTAGSVNITLTTTGNDYNCLAATNSLLVTFKKSPIVFAGNDTKICFGDTVATLSGTITGTTNIDALWTSLGSGTFIQNTNLLNTTYQFSREDRTNGSVKLILKSLDKSLCPSIDDTVTFAFTPLATVNAGNDLEICANQAINLKGSIQGGGTKVKWFTSGSGTFKPTAEALDVSYVPTANDVAQRKIEITLTATDACAPVDDKMVLTFISSPLVMAGASQSICEGSPEVTLSGMITDDGLIDSWKTLGSGTFAPDNKNLRAIYTLGATDIANEKVKLVLSSLPTANCPGGTDTLNILILKQPKADAGKDLTACSNGVVELNGTMVGGAGTGRWESTGTGIFLPADTLLNATYKPSTADVASGLVKLILTSTNNANCIGSSDTLTLTINKSIGSVFDAGIDKQICANSTTQIGGNSEAGFAYKWSPSDGLSDTTVSNPILKYNTTPQKDTVYTYVVTVTETTSKCITKDTVLVTVNPKPKPVLIPNDIVLCGEAKPNAVYEVFGNTKSIFKWIIKEGTIANGEATNKITVNWNEGLGQQLSVVEISPNNCASDTLKIDLKIDNAGILLKVVTNEPPYTGKGLRINWTYSTKQNIPQNVILMRRKKLPVEETLFKNLLTVTNADSSMIDLSADTGAVYEYKIQYTNTCNRSLESTIHNNILLKYQPINEQSATLSWNTYKGWPTGVKAYEIWRKVDGSDSYTLIAEVDSATINYTLTDILYREQYYLVKAIGKANKYESYSNEISLLKLVTLNIPNAISPNGDNVNDKWIIENINLYKENEVKVFNQWNSEVFSQKTYANNWDGAGLPDGTYYYIIKYGDKAERPTDKGFLLIVR